MFIAMQKFCQHTVTPFYRLDRKTSKKKNNYVTWYVKKSEINHSKKYFDFFKLLQLRLTEQCIGVI